MIEIPQNEGGRLFEPGETESVYVPLNRAATPVELVIANGRFTLEEQMPGAADLTLVLETRDLRVSDEHEPDVSDLIRDLVAIEGATSGEPAREHEFALVEPTVINPAELRWHIKDGLYLFVTYVGGLSFGHDDDPSFGAAPDRSIAFKRDEIDGLLQVILSAREALRDLEAVLGTLAKEYWRGLIAGRQNPADAS